MVVTDLEPAVRTLPHEFSTEPMHSHDPLPPPNTKCVVCQVTLLTSYQLTHRSVYDDRVSEIEGVRANPWETFVRSWLPGFARKR